MDRPAGLSVRLKLTLSYAAFLMLAGALLLALWLILERFLSHAPIVERTRSGIGGAFAPGRSPAQRTFGEVAAIVLVFLLVFGLVGGWFLAGRMLAPLDRITQATRLATSGSLAHRITLPGRRDEFRELADSFDAMLARLEAHIAEQRRFAANASHELRTPLAITQTLLDVARNDPSRDADELNERLRAVNARAIKLTEALLLLSRADQRPVIPERVDLSLVAEEAIETLIACAEEHHVTVQISGGPTTSIGSPPLLLQMATNLVHNAIVHNVRQDGLVWVSVEDGLSYVMFTVENTGHQLTPQLVSTLVEPFQRGTERTRGEHAGVGLGLAIVNTIVQAHGGSLHLSARAAGGLRVSARLPVAPRCTASEDPPDRGTTPINRHVQVR